MSKHICTFIILMLASALLTSCSSTDDKLVRQTFEDFLYDVAQKKADHFHFASNEKLKSLGITEKTWSNGNVFIPILTEDENEILDRWQLVLEVLHEDCEEDGFDWNNYSIKSIKYNKAYALENLNGVESYGALGTAELKSNGETFYFSFLITIANGEALYINRFNEKTLYLDFSDDTE